MGGDLSAATLAAIGIAVSPLPVLALAFPAQSHSTLGRLASLVGVHESAPAILLLALLSTAFFLVRGIPDTAA